jgi:hypothetical protein
MKQLQLFSVAVAAAIVVAALASTARAQAPVYTQCVVLKTDFVNETESVTKDKGELGRIPPGWTPVGGTAMPKGMQYAGAVVLCK